MKDQIKEAKIILSGGWCRYLVQFEAGDPCHLIAPNENEIQAAADRWSPRVEGKPQDPHWTVVRWELVEEGIMDWEDDPHYK